MDGWIEGLQFRPGLLRREAPGDSDLGRIAPFPPGGRLRPPGVPVGHAAPKAWPRQRPALDCGPVEPAPVRRRGAKRAPLVPPPRRLGLAGFRPRCGTMCVQIVQDQPDLPGGALGGGQRPEEGRPGPRGAAGGGLHRAPVLVGRTGREEGGRAGSVIFRVAPLRLPGPPGTGEAGGLRRRLAGLLPAPQPLGPGKVPLLKVQPRRPRCPALGAPGRWNAPGRLPPRLARSF